MTPDERRLSDTLIEVCELDSEAAIETYIATIDALRGSTSEDVLRQMLRCLRDTEAGEAQYELVEACEAFPEYVRVFVEEGLNTEKRAPRWFRLMFQSILNTPEDANQAISIINRVDPTSRAAFKRIVSLINEDTPQYAEILARIA